MARKIVNIGEVEATGTSVAVARGKAILAALETEPEVMIDTDDTDGDETVWSEMTAYLARRGVTVAYDHDAGYPVATSRLS